MKRVLLTIHKFFPEHRAGTEVLTLKIAHELQSRGYQVTVLTANPPDSDASKHNIANGQPELVNYDYEGISVYCLTEVARLKDNKFSNEHYHPYLKEHYRKIFEEVAPDLVHCFHLQNLSTSLIEEASERNIPVMYSATDFWLICPIVQLRRPDGSNCLGPAPLGINCLTCYTPKTMPQKNEFDQAILFKYPILKKIDNSSSFASDLLTNGAYLTYLAKKYPESAVATMERHAVMAKYANKLAAITVPTHLMENLFIKSGLDKRAIHHVPYGIDTEPLKKGINKTESQDIRFAFIGALAEHKGPDLLIKAFMDLPPDSKASLKLFGDLEQFPEYGQLLKRLVENDSPMARKISFEGTFPNDQIGDIFQNIDVLVVPSRWYENTPLVIQSALAAKTPVIATNLGGMSEIIIHKINGLLFEVDNKESLQKQLLDIILTDSMLTMLKENIKPERTISKMVDDLEAIYAGIKNLAISARP